MIRKDAVLLFFGGEDAGERVATLRTAIALDCTSQAIAKWPEELSPGVSAKVIVAALRENSRGKVAAAFPGALDAKPLAS